MAIVAAVLLAHALGAQHVGEHLADWRAAADRPQRIEVVYVREMALEVPPDVKAVASPRAVRSGSALRAAAVPAVPASAPQAQPKVKPEPAQQPEPEPVQQPEPEPQPAAPDPPPSEPSQHVVQAEPAPDATSAPESARADTAAPADTAASASSTAAPAAGFAWPRSTRLSYVLTGNYRGELHGSAQVEWIKLDARYQVHLDAVIGLPVAPLFTRRMSSEGLLGDAGLVPEVFYQDSKMALRDRSRQTLRFADDDVWLADGDRRRGWRGVQDTASQFVQLAYLFNTQPLLREPGSRITFPLALPRHVLPWVYEVGERETLYTPFGAIETFHVRPLRSAPPGNLSAEMWFAPALRYLPVRIRLQQDESTYIDLVISRKPELAAE